MKIDQLIPIIASQHENLNRFRMSSKSSCIHKRYEIEELDVKIHVLLSSEKIDLPKKADSKVWKNSARILIDPPNDHVAELVSSHFKSQIIPAYGQTPATYIFDEVTINGEEIVK